MDTSERSELTAGSQPSGLILHVSGALNSGDDCKRLRDFGKAGTRRRISPHVIRIRFPATVQQGITYGLDADRRIHDLVGTFEQIFETGEIYVDVDHITHIVQ